MPLVIQNSSEINEVHTETSHFPGGEWGGREEEVVNAAGSIGGNLQMASTGCTRETCGSVGPGLSEVCNLALLLPSSSKLQDSSEVHVCHVGFIRYYRLS